MGILGSAFKPKTSNLIRLPAGCFTVDRAGRILSSTLPQSFPETEVRKIARIVITAFQTATEAQLMFSELQIHYAALKLTARELKGGAIIFLAPVPRSRPNLHH
jgi:hypothetical protein